MNKEPKRFRMVRIHIAFGLSVLLHSASAPAQSLPAAYFPLLEAGAVKVETHLNSDPHPSLEKLESDLGSWRHFGYAILPPAVLYAKQHPKNPRYHDPKMLALAIRIGDLLASEDEAGTFEPRGDSDWDTSLWLEAYRILEDQLGDERKARWQKALLRNVALVEEPARERLDFPWYNTPYIGTSTNHYAQYASNLLIAGRLFGNKDWEKLGSTILHRLAATEQTPDGYWGEHSRSGPTTGYDHLTLTAVGLYYDYTKDPAALEALRRSTNFHEHFTYADGTPVEVINDRNRHWEVSAWGQFAFSHFPDGRGYAEFLAGFFKPDDLHVGDLGRLAQDALYYQEGPTSPPPQLQQNWSYEMSVPAGIRKNGPWYVCLSGIIATQAINNRFYLDRQGSVSVLHEKLGLIITGANSKRQPELATFSEELMGQSVTVPISSRLQMSDTEDRLSIAYNTFWADLFVPTPSDDGVPLRFVISGKGTPADEINLNLQLVLHAGETLETGAGKKITIGKEPFQLNPQDLGGSISHHGWTMKVDPTASLSWPIYPHNPYADSPESNLRYAVARLSLPLHLKNVPGHYVRPAEQKFEFSVSTTKQ